MSVIVLSWTWRHLISIKHCPGLRLIHSLPCNVQDPDSLVHQSREGPSDSSPIASTLRTTNSVSIQLSERIRSPVSPSIAASILLPASSSSDTLFSQNDSASSSQSEHILPIFAPAPLLVCIDLTEGDEANPITIE